MDIGGLIGALVAWLQANWNVIEPLLQRLAADLVALWVLLLAVAEIIKKFLPKSTVGQTLSTKLLGVIQK